MAENQSNHNQAVPKAAPQPESQPEPQPEPPPFSPDLELIGYIEKGQNPLIEEPTAPPPQERQEPPSTER